ncbi:MAG: sulfatase-like hydrolase/transferase, partial [Clostridia bacterium]
HIHTLSEGPQGEYLTDRLTDEAIHLIENAGDQPFFLNLCHYAVHTPIQAKAQDVARFREKARTLGLDDQKAIVEGEWMPIWHKRNEHVQRRTLQSDPEYAAMIWNLDENIGRLVAALKDAGKLENTMLVFTSDNGGLSTSEGSPTCNAPASEGKGWLYEGGTRVPLFICWHGTVEAGSECDTPVTTPDFYPTFLEAAGLAARPEQHCDGVSLLPLLQGKSLAPRPIFWHYPHYGNQGGTPGSSVRLGDDKLIEFFEDGRLELYDLSKDLGESKDISAEQPEKTRELAALLHEWQIAVQAKLPAVNGDY